MKDTATLSRLFTNIQVDLDQVDSTFEGRATSGLDILNTASMHALGSPGKRLRTALTLLSGKMKTYRFDKLLPLSVAFEMVHLATLIHDDIVDNATTRRGNPTVNALWGNNIAILLGDYYFAKTAGLIAACCKGGAIVSQAADEEIELLYAYGLNLGIAFQIIDDILDYTEDQATIGKPAGNDLRQGMVTLPLIYALQEQPRNGQYQAVHRLLNGTSQREEDLLSVINWVNEGQGVERSRADAYNFANKAQAALYHFPASQNREVLDQLIDFVVARKH